MTDADRDYLEAQGLEQKIADALAIVLREKPRDAAGRMAELLLPAPMAKDRVSISLFCLASMVASAERSLTARVAFDSRR